MVTYSIDCPVCGVALTAGDNPFAECPCRYLRLTPAGVTLIRDGRGDAEEPGYSVTRGLHVTTTQEEATNARHRRTAGDPERDGGGDS